MKSIVIALSMALSVAAFAQEREAKVEKELYYIHIEHVKPAMRKAYEKAAKAIVHEFEEYEIDPDNLMFRTVVGPELGYVYVFPLDSFASMDDLNESYREAIETIGAKRWAELTSRASDSIERSESFHSVHRPDLSHTPENPSLKPEDVRYINYRFYYAIPGMERTLEQVTKDFRRLYKRKGVQSGWSVYKAVTGTDLPLYVVAEAAKSPADYAARVERQRGILGEEGRRLGDKASSCLRRIEQKGAWIRPDLSYPPAPMPAAAMEERD